ncbi:MAG: hypothetical protein JXQ65_05365 [Candidatus Marinimicrobia bacterium]|nr:hypothetical protein [Candidatus Neomarinimicrobiota bacterium]
MKMKATLLLCVLIFMASGCSPVSHILVGEMREPVDPSQVKVYGDFPENFEKIAIIEAGSDFAIKDPAILFSHQSKTNKALERLKLEAAALGANGIVIENLATNIKQDVSVWSDDDGNVHSSTSNNPEKSISAIAIFVK